MSKEIAGICTLLSPAILAEGMQYALYPSGRHLRGACGYIAMQLGLKIADEFLFLEKDGVIYRDMLPVCAKCGQIIFPNQNAQMLCSCGFVYDERLNLFKVRTRKEEFEEVREGNKFRFSIVIKDEKWLEDVQNICMFIQKYGINLGKKTSSGYGLIQLSDFLVRDISPKKETDNKLVSHYITKSANGNLVIGQFLKKINSFTKVNLSIKMPKGSQVNESSKTGFYLGDLGSLGFGEI